MGLFVRAAVGVLAAFWVMKNLITALSAIVAFADTVLSWGDDPPQGRRSASPAHR